LLASVLAPLGHSQAAAQDKPAAEQHPVSKSAAVTQNPTPHENVGDGEGIFAQNCSRCHNAPDGFSSRISGTVLRHMRVRASLSKHDEAELMRFFNP
jgi:cytochrome c2